MISLLRKNLYQTLVALFALFCFASCQKDLVDTDVIVPNNETPDLTTKVNSSVSGFVTDENNAAVLGAIVKMGGSTTTTDKYGFFEINNVQVIKNAATVTVSKPGYFNGIKTYLATADKSAFFRIKLIPKTIAGAISATAGGNVTLPNGLIVALPIDAVVNAGSGTAYSGPVNVAAYWIDPTAADLFSIMPGDLRALNTSGALKSLQTYGMAAVELTGAGGELLQIASGKKATLTFPLPAVLSASAPASIPLWYFDEGIGLWKEEGSATKTGNTYVGEVAHFSFWNCDVPNSYVQFSSTFVNSDGTPISYAWVQISVVGSTMSAWGWTDATGYVAGAIPDNANLQLDVYTSYNCSNSVYSQTFTSTNANVSLGTITVPNSSSNLANVTATVTDCSMAPVANGYLLMQRDYQYFRYPTNSAGEVQFVTTLCGGSQAVLFIAENLAVGQQSTPLTFTLNAGANNLGTLQACGVTTDQFIHYVIDAADTLYTAPADSFNMYVNTQVTPNWIEIQGSRYGTGTYSYISFAFTSTGIAAGSTQALTMLYGTGYAFNFQPPTINVNITEYGAVGEFIAGNFTGTVYDNSAPPGNSHTATVSFRVRRMQ